MYGLLVPCKSPCNTPILAILKPTGEYRFVQDLRAVNEAVELIYLIVPNPYTILAQIPGEANWFTLLDLKDAFFCIPLAKESQCFFFVFLFFFCLRVDRHRYKRNLTITWTPLPQGFRDSLHIFGMPWHKT